MSSSQKGFTLAEVLIALALLGVVAAFTIPKVLQSTGTSSTNSRVKETIATLEQAWYNSKIQNTVVVGGATGKLYDTIQPQLNVIASAATALAAGVPAGVTAAYPCLVNADSKTGWVQFANGVLISGLAGGAAGSNIVAPTGIAQGGAVPAAADYVVCIDADGPKAGANAIGNDIFFGNFSEYASVGACGGNTANPNAKNFFWGDGVLFPYTAACAQAAAPYNVVAATAYNPLTN